MIHRWAGVAKGSLAGAVVLFGSALDRFLEAVAWAVHFDNVAAMGEAIEQGGGHAFALEDLGPLAEGQVAGDQDTATLITIGEDLEQQLGGGAAD